ncbi:MAG TPA: hypothetical protein PLU35_08960, partial [Phycisphaerales bacterium]|nr:hypothetical protein [Phycisphaerales bacterium]
QPSRRAASLGPPPGIDPLVLMPIDRDSDAWRRATLSYEEAVREAASSARPIEAAEPQAGRDDSTDALRLYASGRQRLLDGDAVGAVRDLERASILDPGSAEVWRTLGAAQSAAGQASGAMASMRRAVALGLVDAQAFATLGRHALRLGDDADAVAMLARALASNPGASDPALRTVVLVDLADALHERGFLTASAEAVRRAIEQPERISGSTVYRAELGAIVRRAGELWRRVGDDACRLGDFDRALSAYRRAAASPALDPGAVAPRRVYASLRLGRSAEAALAVLDEVRHETGRTDPRLVGLVRHVAACSPRRSVSNSGRSARTPHRASSHGSCVPVRPRCRLPRRDAHCGSISRRDRRTRMRWTISSASRRRRGFGPRPRRPSPSRPHIPSRRTSLPPRCWV